MALSGYPETDRDAHRSVAKVLRVVGLILFFGGGYFGISGYGIPSWLIGMLLAMLFFVMDTTLRMRALRWHVEDVLEPRLEALEGDGPKSFEERVEEIREEEE